MVSQFAEGPQFGVIFFARVDDQIRIFVKMLPGPDADQNRILADQRTSRPPQRNFTKGSGLFIGFSRVVTSLQKNSKVKSWTPFICRPSWAHASNQGHGVQGPFSGSESYPPPPQENNLKTCQNSNKKFSK